MPVVLYSAPFSSASPVASALVELDVPHETVTLDLAAGDQRKPEIHALNPNGKVPTLVVEGTPMFEALAIMLWLGERYGVDRGLWPAKESPARLEALSWSTWAYVTYGTFLVRLQLATSPQLPEELHSKPQADLARKELERLLTILDARLAKHGNILGEEFSLADLIVASVVGYGAYLGASVDGQARVKAWLTAFQERRSYKAVMGS
jgi:glutathione S-transferase